MKRREAIIARQQERKPITLLESDYLLGVFDGNRMGAIRFKTDPGYKIAVNYRPRSVNIK
jgi:serine/threonine-protein kinase HipA